MLIVLRKNINLIIIFLVLIPFIKTDTVNAIDYRRYELISKGSTLVGYTKYKSKAGSNRVKKLGNNPKYLCCSSFVSWCFTKSKVCKMDYSTVSLRYSNKFYRIKKRKILPGDIGFIHNSNKSDRNHVGIYIGKRNGKLLWLHCTGHGNQTGVTIGTDKRLKVFYRYKGFKD